MLASSSTPRVSAPTLGRATPRAAALRVVAAAPSNRTFADTAKTAGAALALSGALLAGAVTPALAELNQYEYNAGGEFGIGSAQQYGEADIQGRDFSNQDLRRANFTSADARNANFSGAKLQGAFFIKAVVPNANFQYADLSDVLMDRAVIVGADLRQANLERAVFTRSDFTGANIEGADFSNALVDRTQQIALCRTASGTNELTGISTRKSLGCGSKRGFKSQSPSNPDGPAGASAVSEETKAAFRATTPKYYE